MLLLTHVAAPPAAAAEGGGRTMKEPLASKPTTMSCDGTDDDDDDNVGADDDSSGEAAPASGTGSRASPISPAELCAVLASSAAPTTAEGRAAAPSAEGAGAMLGRMGQELLSWCKVSCCPAIICWMWCSGTGKGSGKGRRRPFPVPGIAEKFEPGGEPPAGGRPRPRSCGVHSSPRRTHLRQFGVPLSHLTFERAHALQVRPVLGSASDVDPDGDELPLLSFPTESLSGGGSLVTELVKGGVGISVLVES
mmetsp:Transcript_11327/g.22727  ORF Transcript_11327/g.22727 Transcript_11327/m.22727 type:complete len:251 (+) Transcript_11327:583-1335(+)